MFKATFRAVLLGFSVRIKVSSQPTGYDLAGTDIGISRRHE
jgi:hypothetical protein